MSGGAQIRQLDLSELPQALELAWQVFCGQLAAGCAEEDVRDFAAGLDYEYTLHRAGDGSLRFWGAFLGADMVGMCALREGDHVALLFVRPEHQGRGAGTALLKKALLDCKALDDGLEHVTTLAFAPARGFFEALGFAPAGDENAARLPMRLSGTQAGGKH